MVRRILTDEIWKQLEAALLEVKDPRGAPGDLTEREFIEAVLFLARTGTPWRDLPAEFGLWSAVYMRFRRWEKRGVWQRLWENLQAEPMAGAREVMLDSTTVRAHPHAAGAPKKSPLRIKLWAALAAASPPKSTRPPSTKTARSRST